MLSQLYKKDIAIVFILIATFIFIRSLHFPLHLNFSQEPASHALDSYKLWSEKKVTFVGPALSYKFEGRSLFQSSLGYYFMMLFLVPTNFDPLTASYAFMLFAALSIIPLYYGTKMLINKHAAVFVSTLFALLPFYIDFTRFFWYPNFQLALSPYIIFFMGMYKIHKNRAWLLLTAFLSGVLFLLHYLYMFIIVALFGYYVVIRKIGKRNTTFFISGLVMGTSPLIFFEIRNQFYNTQTIILFLQNAEKVFGSLGSNFSRHYVLSFSLFVFLGLLVFVQKKLRMMHVFVLYGVLFIASLFIYVLPPSHAYGMTNDWNYVYEKKVYKVIKEQNLENYNISNLGYDTLAIVPKYLLYKDGVRQNFDDYYNNQYLFVVSKNPGFMNEENLPYEVDTFRPSRLFNVWEINKAYSLYLLERDKSN